MSSSVGYYDDRNPLLKGTLSSVERDRQRERERQARAAMSVQAEQAAAGGAPDSRHGHHHHGHHNHGHHADSHAATASLFRAPVKVNPDAQDRTTQQIQSKLGNYSVVRHLLDDPKRLIGIDGVPASPAPAHPSRLPSGSGSSTRSSPSSQEFKKPGGPRSSSNSNSSSHASAQRGGFVKPADGKPPYGGRGGYPGQPVKHGGNSNDHRSHGLLPAKGPPPPTSSGSSSSSVSSLPNTNTNTNSNRLHSASNRLPRMNLDNGINSRQALEENTPDVEDILKEMTSAATPLTAIPQTPRKEVESKFTFNPVLAKLTEVPPLEPPRPQRERHSTSRLSTNLERDLSLSEDSEDEVVDKVVPSRPIPDLSVDLTAPLLPAMASGAGPPLPPMSPMGMSPIVAMSPTRPLSPPASSPIIKQPMPTPPRMLSPTISSPVNKRSPNPTVHQRPPSPPGQAPPSSGSASSSSDSGSDSCTDSSDDSEDEVTQPPIKGPSTPPSVSPPAPVEEPPSAVEESKRRWDLSSFMNKTSLQTGDQNAETKPKQNDASRRAVSPNAPAEAKSRRETNRNGVHDWKLDEALKRTRNSTMMSVLSDSEHQSDTEKPQVKAEPEKPKAPDVRKRGRPRKSVKSPKPNHRTSEENSKSATKRSRPRAGSSVGANSSLKKKVPTSKSTVSSDDASDARSPAASSDSESDRPSTIPSASAVKMPIKRRSRLSVSSNEEGNASDKNSGSDEESRWRRVSMKRNKHSESPKKQQEKKKSPTKTNPRRPRSRVTNNSGCHSDSDSDSEFTSSEAVRNSRIQVARVPPRPRAPLTRATSPDNSDSDTGPASGKLQEEDGGNVQDKKKSDTLRKLFSSAKGGGKGGGKGGKGGKGGGKCGIYVEEYTSANTPTGGESPYKRLSSQTSTIPIPPINYVNGLPSVLCRIDLSRISHIPQPSRGKELRQRTELPDTRPSSRQNTSALQSQRSSTPEEGEIVELPPQEARSHRDGVATVDTDSKKNIVIKKEIETKPCSVNIINMCKGDGDSVGLMNTSSGSSAGTAGSFSGNAPKRRRNLSCSSVSSLGTVCSVDVKVKEETKEKKKKRKRKHLESDVVASRSSANQQIDVQPTNHEREEKPDTDEAPPPEAKRLYFSYFDPPAQVKEDEERDQNQYLTEAKRLKHSADVESDTTAQGMMYIEAVMYFVLTGCTMENDPVTERSSFTMYRDTLSLIKFISSKFKTQHASESSINTKLIVLSLWCQSLIYMKLYQMRKVEVREHQKVLTDYYQKQTPSTPVQPEGQGTPSLSPTPSPAGSVGSVGSQSSGYSSGELAHRCANGQLQAASYVSVPLGVYNAFSSQHYHFGLLMSGHDLWDQANSLVTGEHKKFFIELDGKIGPLTLKSSLRDLVNYVLEGINKMRAL